LSLYADDIILYQKDPKNSTKKLLDFINTLSKVTENKINTQKSVAFPYTNTEQFEKEIRKTVSLKIASETLKYLVINFMKQVTNLYNENYKSLEK
jgi:hypothetical protein